MKILKESQLDNNSPGGFLMEQLLLFTGSIPLIIAGIFALFAYKSFSSFRFIGICFIIVIAGFAILKAKLYYSAGIYPVMLIFGALFLEKSLNRPWKKIIIPSLIGFNFLVFILISKVVFPVLSPSEIIQNRDIFEKTGMLRWEDGKIHQLPQDFADMIGWKEMASKALIAFEMIPAGELENTLVFCDNYGQTGALNYYNRGKMKEAYSFSTDYIFWLPLITNINNVIFVGEEPDKEIIDLFSDCKIVAVVENVFSREKGTSIFLFTGALPSFTSLFYKIAEERKRNLDIF
jgi:hypothetical protein